MPGNVHLRRKRQQQRLAQAALAVMARVSPGLIVAVERHGHVPSPGVRARLACALRTHVGELWPVRQRAEPTTRVRRRKSQTSGKPECANPGGSGGRGD
jgi:transcriptional regulator with XRE-family HTH domain